MNRRWIAMLGAVGVLGLVIGVAIIDRYHVGVFHDDAMYVILARSIATGQGFRYLNLPGAPVASHFPPGYPAVLSLLWRVAPEFPANLIAFKALNAVCLAISAVLVAQLARERLESERWGLAAGIVTTISVPLLVLVTMVLSEPLFLVTLVTSLILAERLVSGATSLRLAISIGLLAGITTLVRTHGIALIPAIALPLLVRRRWVDVATFVAGAFVMLVPWQLWTSTHAGVLPSPIAGNYGSYLSWWMRGFHAMGPSMITETLRRTVTDSLAMLAALFAPVRGTLSHTISLIALGLGFSIGAISLRRRAPVTLLFLAGYAVLVLLWPFPPSRFVWGMWPLLLFVLFAAGQAVSARSVTMPTFLRIVSAVALLWVGVGYAAYEQRAARGRWWASISRAADGRVSPAIAWTLAHTAPMDIVASDDEGAVFLYTGRRAVPVASFTTAHYLSERSAIVEANEGLVPLLSTYPLRAVLVGSPRTFDAAQYLATRPVPLLALRDQFAGGAAFTVLTR
ncbi:MAG: hypothetical protein ABI969_09370 [bacterium]